MSSLCTIALLPVVSCSHGSLLIITGLVLTSELAEDSISTDEVGLVDWSDSSLFPGEWKQRNSE